MVIYPWQPNMDRSVSDNFGSADSSLPCPPPSQISFSHRPAELLPMLQVAATFLGYPANDPNGEEERKQEVWGTEDGQSPKFIYLSAEDPVFETACKTDTNMMRGLWIERRRRQPESTWT